MNLLAILKSTLTSFVAIELMRSKLVVAETDFDHKLLDGIERDNLRAVLEELPIEIRMPFINGLHRGMVKGNFKDYNTDYRDTLNGYTDFQNYKANLITFHDPDNYATGNFPYIAPKALQDSRSYIPLNDKTQSLADIRFFADSPAYKVNNVLSEIYDFALAGLDAAGYPTEIFNVLKDKNAEAIAWSAEDINRIGSANSIILKVLDSSMEYSITALQQYKNDENIQAVWDRFIAPYAAKCRILSNCISKEQLELAKSHSQNQPARPNKNRLNELSQKTGLSTEEKEEFLDKLKEEIAWQLEHATRRLSSNFAEVTKPISEELDALRDQLEGLSSDILLKQQISNVNEKKMQAIAFATQLENQAINAGFGAVANLAVTLQGFGGKYQDFGKILGIGINLGQQAFNIFQNNAMNAEQINTMINAGTDAAVTGLASSAATSLVTFNYISLAFTAVQMFSSFKSKPSAEQQMLKHIMKSLSTMFDKLSQISEQISLIDKKIYGLSKLSETILDRLYSGFREISSTLALISIDVTNAQAKIDKLTDDLMGIMQDERKRFDWITEALVEDFRKKILDDQALCDDFNTIDLQRYKDILTTTKMHATYHSFSDTATKRTEHWQSLVDIARAKFAAGGNLNEIIFDGFGTYLLSELAANKISAEMPAKVPNIVDVYLGIKAYAKVVACYPQFKGIDAKGTAVKELTQVVTNHLATLERLANPKFANYVSDLYRAQQDEFAKAYKYTLQQFIKDHNHKLKLNSRSGHLLGLNPSASDALWGESDKAQNFGYKLYPKELLFGGQAGEEANLIDLLFAPGRSLHEITSVDNDELLDEKIRVDNIGLKAFFAEKCKDLVYLHDCLFNTDDLLNKSLKQLNIPERYDIYLPIFMLVKENIHILQALAHGHLDPENFKLKYNAYYQQRESNSSFDPNPAQGRPGNANFLYNKNSFNIRFSWYIRRSTDLFSCSAHNTETNKYSSYWSLCETKLQVKLLYGKDQATLTTHLVNTLPFTALNGFSYDFKFWAYPNTYSTQAPICEGKGDSAGWDIDVPAAHNGKYPIFKSSKTKLPYYVLESAFCSGVGAYFFSSKLLRNAMPRASYFVGDEGFRKFNEQVTPKSNDFLGKPWNAESYSWIVPSKHCHRMESTIDGPHVSDSNISPTQNTKFSDCEEREKLRLQTVEKTVLFYDLVQKSRVSEAKFIKYLQGDFYSLLADKLEKNRLFYIDNNKEKIVDIDDVRLKILAMVDMVLPNSLINDATLKVLLKQNGLHSSKSLRDAFLIAIGELKQHNFDEQTFEKDLKSLPAYDLNYEKIAMPPNNIVRKNILNTFLDSFAQQYNILRNRLQSAVTDSHYKFALGFTQQASLSQVMQELLANNSCSGRFSKFETCVDELGNQGYQVYDCNTNAANATKVDCDVTASYPESQAFQYKISEAERAFHALYGDNVEPPRALIDEIVRKVRGEDTFEYAKRILIDSPMMYHKFNNIFIKYTNRNLTSDEWNLAKTRISVDKYNSLIPDGEVELFTDIAIEKFIQERMQAISQVTNLQSSIYGDQFSALDTICDDFDPKLVNIWLPKQEFDNYLNKIQDNYKSIAFINDRVDAASRVVVSNNGMAVMQNGIPTLIEPDGHTNNILAATTDMQLNSIKIFNFKKDSGKNHYEITATTPGYVYKNTCKIQDKVYDPSYNANTELNCINQYPERKCTLMAMDDQYGTGNGWDLRCHRITDYAYPLGAAKWKLIYFAKEHKYAIYNLDAHKFLSINKENTIELINSGSSKCHAPQAAKLNVLPMYSRNVPKIVTARDVAVGANSDVWVIDSFDFNVGGGNIRKNGPIEWESVNNIGADKLAVAPDGTVWMVNKLGDVHSYKDGNLELRGGTARDIAASSTGKVCLVDNFDNNIGGGKVRCNNGNNNWGIVIEVGANKIAIGPDDTIWMVNKQGNVHSYKDGQLVHRGGTAKDIAVGANGDVWIIDNFEHNAGGGKLRKNTGGNNWDILIQAGPDNVIEKIAVAADGTIWAVNSQGLIYKAGKDRVLKLLDEAMQASEIAKPSDADVVTTPHPTMPRLNLTLVKTKQPVTFSPSLAPTKRIGAPSQDSSNSATANAADLRTGAVAAIATIGCGLMMA